MLTRAIYTATVRPEDVYYKMVYGICPQPEVRSVYALLYNPIFRNTIPQTLNPILSEYRRPYAYQNR